MEGNFELNKLCAFDREIFRRFLKCIFRKLTSEDVQNLEYHIAFSEIEAYIYDKMNGIINQVIPLISK